MAFDVGNISSNFNFAKQAANNQSAKASDNSSNRARGGSSSGNRGSGRSANRSSNRSSGNNNANANKANSANANKSVQRVNSVTDIPEASDLNTNQTLDSQNVQSDTRITLDQDQASRLNNGLRTILDGATFLNTAASNSSNLSDRLASLRDLAQVAIQQEGEGELIGQDITDGINAIVDEINIAANDFQLSGTNPFSQEFLQQLTNSITSIINSVGTSTTVNTGEDPSEEDDSTNALSINQAINDSNAAIENDIFDIDSTLPPSTPFLTDASRPALLPEIEPITIQGAGSANNAVSSVNFNSGNTIESQIISVNGASGVENFEVAENATAAQIANQINESTAATGISAISVTTATLSDFSTEGRISFDLGTDVSKFTKKITTDLFSNNLNDLVTQINNVSDETGVTAELSVDGARVLLREGQGNNILINNFRSSEEDATFGISGSDGTVVTLKEGSSNLLNKDSTVVSGTVNLQIFAPSNEVDLTLSVLDNGLRSDQLIQNNLVQNSFSATAPPTNSSANTAVTSSEFRSINILPDLDLNENLESVPSILNEALSNLSTLETQLNTLNNQLLQTVQNSLDISDILQQDQLDAERLAQTISTTIQQAGSSIPAQANLDPDTALSLLIN